MTVDQRIIGYCKANRVEQNCVEQQRVETDPAISQNVQTCCECWELLYCVCVSEHECVRFSNSICLNIMLAYFPNFFPENWQRIAKSWKSPKIVHTSSVLYCIYKLFISLYAADMHIFIQLNRLKYAFVLSIFLVKLN